MPELINRPAKPKWNGITSIYTILLLFNILAWTIFAVIVKQVPVLLPWGLLAFVFGLRHAADADHIAAIDNTTRKLINDDGRPAGVGFFFSIGHSTVVVLMAIGLAVTAKLLTNNMRFFNKLKYI